MLCCCLVKITLAMLRQREESKIVNYHWYPPPIEHESSYQRPFHVIDVFEEHRACCELGDLRGLKSIMSYYPDCFNNPVKGEWRKKRCLEVAIYHEKFEIIKFLIRDVLQCIPVQTLLTAAHQNDSALIHVLFNEGKPIQFFPSRLTVQDVILAVVKNKNIDLLKLLLKLTPPEIYSRLIEVVVQRHRPEIFDELLRHVEKNGDEWHHCMELIMRHAYENGSSCTAIYIYNLYGGEFPSEFLPQIGFVRLIRVMEVDGIQAKEILSIIENIYGKHPSFLALALKFFLLKANPKMIQDLFEANAALTVPISVSGIEFQLLNSAMRHDKMATLLDPSLKKYKIVSPRNIAFFFKHLLLMNDFPSMYASRKTLLSLGLTVKDNFWFMAGNKSEVLIKVMQEVFEAQDLRKIQRILVFMDRYPLEIAFIEFVWSFILSPNWNCFIEMIQGALATRSVSNSPTRLETKSSGQQ